MNYPKIDKALSNVLYNPYNALYNFILGYQYEEIGQTTSAFSYFLRAAEFSSSDLLSYESLLRCASCIEKERNRIHTLKGILLRAIGLLPKRPEAYYILSRIYQYNEDWQECYTTAATGELMVNNDNPKLMTDFGYKGDYVLTFHKMVAAWWIGLFDECLMLLRNLDRRVDIVPEYKLTIKDNISNFGFSIKRSYRYNNSLYPQLRFKFNNAKNIERNFSQTYQDMFVLTMLNGKKEGTFLEIGCDDAYAGNNTALLEKEFNWTGISIDIDAEKTKEFKKHRNSEVITADALQIDYNKLLTRSVYDYLQIDCNPASTSFKVLQRIPFENHKFAVITFEHDNYIDPDRTVKENSRKYLESYGYTMIVNNISEDRWSDFEDWYVHPDLIDKKIIEKMLCISNDIKKSDFYMLNK